MKTVSKVLVDTCFLIELADKGKPYHKVALEYFNYFNENDVDYYLSPIVVAEYWHNNLITDFPSTNFKHLTFSYVDGFNTGQVAKVINEKKIKKGNGENRDAVKDDYKLLAQLIVNNKIDCFITKDANMISKFVEPLKAEFPTLNNVCFIDIENQPIEKTFKPQTSISFPDSGQ